MSTSSQDASRSGYTLAYREARRELDDQERSVVDLEPPDGEPLESHQIERDLALHMGRSAAFNRRQLQRLMTIFRFGALLLVAEVLAWVLALMIRG